MTLVLGLILSGLQVVQDSKQGRTETGPPSRLEGGWAEINAGRVRVGKKPLRWNDRLYRAAQRSCDERPFLPEEDHHQLRRRLDDAGWQRREGRGTGPPGARMQANFGEMEAGPSPVVRSPEEHARFWVEYLSGPPGDNAHRDDWRASWTDGAIGCRGDLFVIIYGYDP